MAFLSGQRLALLAESAKRARRRALILVFCGALAIHFSFILIVLLHLDDVMSHRSNWRGTFSAVNSYSMVTFANRNFGFFAPGVTPDWNVDCTTFDEQGTGRAFAFLAEGGEMKVKMYSMLGHFAENDDTMDLFARSWAAYVMNARPGTVRVTIDVTRNVLPSMQEYREGRRITREPFYKTTFERQPDLP